MGKVDLEHQFYANINKNDMKIENKLWQVSLLLLFIFLCAPVAAQDTELVASNDEENILVLEPDFNSEASTNHAFEKKYHYLVARSYFRLLAEAQKSERKLKLQLEQYTQESKYLKNKKSHSFQRKYEIVQKKYSAHSAMLSGLKSWNLFSDYRTGDMFYFMAENEERILHMMKKNYKEEKMINFLIYRLADLYHIEGQ